METLRNLFQKRQRSNARKTLSHARGNRLLVERLESRRLLAVDILMTSVTSDGHQTLTINYNVPDEAVPAGGFRLGVYTSQDNALDGADALVDSINITDAGDLTAGAHSITRMIGPAANELALPTSGATAVQKLLFVADDDLQVAESNEANNTAVFAGAYHSGGTLVIHGTDAADTVTLSDSAPNLQLTLNAAPFNYVAADVNGVIVAAHAGADTVNASATAEPGHYAGGAGNDTLTGGSGGDTYFFNIDTQQGQDLLNESAGGDDAISVVGANKDITLDLSRATLQVVHTNLRLVLGSSTAFESVNASGRFIRLTGNDAANTLQANAVASTLQGGLGDDELLGGSGNDTYLFDTDLALGTDTITDGGGIDSLDFSATTTRQIALNLGSANQVINAGLTLIGATEIEHATGGSLVDNLIGNAKNNRLVGGPGDDALDGGLGRDNLYGGAGKDNLVGGEGDDNLVGDGDNDQLQGGPGKDTLTGSAGNDTLHGGVGSDTYMFGTAVGNETDEVGELASQGVDALNFSGVTTTVTVDLSNDLPDIITVATHTGRTVTVDTASFVVKEIENVIGGTADDTITGNAAANNYLNGGAGNDTLFGLGGDDALDGGLGDDSLVGGTGNDSYRFSPTAGAESDVVEEQPNEGTDELNFSAINVAVTVDLLSDTIATHADRTVNTAAAGMFANFENVVGGTASDAISGNDANNTLNGLSGDDTISGLAGNDSLYGGAGNDSLTGGTGDDSYFFLNAVGNEVDNVAESGGGGIDRLNFASVTANMKIDLSEIATNVLAVINTDPNNPITRVVVNDPGMQANFENVTGGLGNDVLIGNAANNALVGGAGNDTLIGLAGDDRLEGGLGNDHYEFDADTALGTDVILDIAGIDHITFFETALAVTCRLNSSNFQAINANLSLKFSSTLAMETADGGTGHDLLVGNNNNNRLRGNFGNDTLQGLNGDDTLRGGGGGIDPNLDGDDALLGGDGTDTGQDVTANDSTNSVENLI